MEDREAARVEHGVGHALHVRAGYGSVARESVVHVAGVPAQHGGMRDRVRPVAEPGAPVQEPAPGAVARPLHFFLFDAAAEQVIDDVPHLRLEVGGGDAGAGGRDDEAHSGALGRPREGGHVGRHLLFVHERLLEAGTVPVGEQVVEGDDGLEVGVRVARRMIQEVHAGHLNAVRKERAPLSASHRQGDVRTRRHGSRGNLAEPGLDPIQGFARIEIANEYEGRVVGTVVKVEELVDVLEPGRVDVGHVADGRMTVGVPLVVGALEQGLEREAVGAVLVRLPPLVLHDFALVVELLLRDPGLEEPHAVGLQPQAEIEFVRGQGLEVVRAVEPRRAVERAAGILHELEVLLLRHVLGSLEEEMLEEVREAGAAGALVLRSHMVHDVNGDEGSGRIGLQDHSQPVVERVLAEFEPHRRARRWSQGFSLSVPLLSVLQ